MRSLAIIPGDGIGPEVIAEGIRVLEAISEISSFSFEAEYFEIGSERYLRNGILITDEEYDALSKKDAIYFGAIGDPRVRPGILEKGILLAMRARFDQYINLRPVRSWHPYVPLKKHFDFNMHFLRENTEDFYIGAGGNLTPGAMEQDMTIRRGLYRLDLSLKAKAEPEDEFGFEIGVLSRKGVERFAEYAIEYAIAHGHHRVTLVDKANVCPSMYGMQRTIFQEKADDKGIEMEYMYVDAMAMAMLIRPHTFGTIAVPNLFGDILTDLGAQLGGGLGMGASGNINPNGVSMFEPIHGSAPDIAGQGKANPFAALMAAKMMLDHLGYAGEAEMLESALTVSLQQNATTPDLGGSLRTSEVTDFVIQQLRH
ncbi:MAG: 3-isopropylmalate dehydrogenase [Candidatus Methanomethylophilaceae archaeon]|nr:3-isopropylmalate dehydrogenase [Candidatus Methanomethylophilaceae archaeon]MDI3542064.1 3-isopropylmalate dehydrogenase [Candidatus Methanomethylophilaceae archaeon]HIJ00819.1 isocitrate/isopropylmalate dehydrogenase family protein [Candidatus Methanomethylophilaceae archaeon]